MLKRIAVLAAASLLPLTASAQGVTSYSCTYDDMVRRVEILTEAGAPVPCEVRYHKETEAPGEHQILWSAQNDASYCETKTTEFVAQLESWGWNCSAGESAPMSMPAEPPMTDDAMDDTGALAPAEEMMDEAEEMAEDMAEDMEDDAADMMDDGGTE